MRSFSVVTLVGLFLLCVGCGGGLFGFSLPGDSGTSGDGTTPQEGVASVAGVVRDGATGEPLANARVVFGGNRQLTDSAGMFAFRNVNVVVRAQRALRQATGTMVTLGVSLEQFDSFVQQFSITDPIPDQEILLTPNPGSASVSGLVRDAATRNPIVDTTVRVGTGSALREAHTDLEGTFLVTGAQPGRQQLTANAPGFVTHTQILENLNPGLTFELTGPIELLPAGTTVSVSGTVRDEDGNALGGALVQAGGASAQTLATGFYQLGAIAVGPQSFTVSAAGFLTSSFTIEITGSQGAVNVVLFRSGVNPPAVPFTVRGRVILANTSDHSGVIVSALELPGNTEADSVITGSDGRYQLFIPEGQYTIRAERTGFRTAERNVTVPPGGQVVDNVDLALSQN